MNSQNHVTDLLPCFVLDILSEEETCLVLEHLAECETCRAELDVYQRTADQLPLALAPCAPPESIKEHILQTVSPELHPKSNTSWRERAQTFFHRIIPFGARHATGSEPFTEGSLPQSIQDN